jgi:tRNA(Ile)-lysidine synthase
LEQINPQLGERMGALTAQVQLEEEFWQQQLQQVFPPLVLSREDGMRLDRSRLLELHPALRRRVLREALRQLRGDLQRIANEHLLAVERLLGGSRSQAQLDLPGCWVARRYGTLWLRLEEPPLPQAFDLLLPLPGELRLPGGRVLRAGLQAEQQGESLQVAEFSLSELKEPLRVRSWQPGDCFAPHGMAGHKRLKRYFSDQRIELEERTGTPLLVCGETILWLIGHRRSRHAPASVQAGPILRLELL